MKRACVCDSLPVCPVHGLSPKNLEHGIEIPLKCKISAIVQAYRSDEGMDSLEIAGKIVELLQRQFEIDTEVQRAINKHFWELF